MIRNTAGIRQIPSPPSVATLAMPRALTFRFSVGLSTRGIAAALIGVGIAAMSLYIAAVNTLLLDGETLRHGQGILVSLERDVANLEELIAERRSPSWVQESSRRFGMVSVTSVRYLRTDQPVAVAR